MEKYRKAVKFLKKGTLENLSLKNGGSKQTLELYRRAAAEYDEQIKECKRIVFSLIYILGCFLTLITYEMDSESKWW